MERFISLDIGDKRIGVAVSDPFNSYALPVKTVFRKNLKTDLAEIEKICKEKFAKNIENSKIHRFVNCVSAFLFYSKRKAKKENAYGISK